MPNNFGGDQNDPEYDLGARREKAKPPAATRSLGGHLFEHMQRARKELRHQAHVYANTKDRARRDDAGLVLEQAALAFAFSAALHGNHSSCARPAGKTGEEWFAALDPETALEAERAAKRPRGKKRGT